MRASNQIEISDKINTKLLIRLEKRALKRRNYFSDRLKHFSAEIIKYENGDGKMASINYTYRNKAKVKLNSWTERLEKIHKILTERFLLTDTEIINNQ